MAETEDTTITIPKPKTPKRSYKGKKRGPKKRRGGIPYVAPKRPVGRPRLGCLPYDQAKKLVQRHNITSRRKYERWHRFHNIMWAPLYPSVRYREIWVSWNDYLGTDNLRIGEVRDKAQFRPYWEAVRWMHTTDYTSWLQYRDAYNAGKIPSDIPKYPWKIYEEYTHDAWYGRTALSKIEARDSVSKYWVLVQLPGEENNVVWFLKVEGNDWKKHDWVLLRRWRYEEELLSTVQLILEENSSEYFEVERRLCSNVAGLIYNLDRKLLIERD